MNSPGGLSVAEYLDCHTQVFPYNFDSLGIEVADALMRLVNEIFFNDVLELQYRGKLCPVLFISAAHIIGSKNYVIRDVITKKIIVMKVMKAVELANIENTRVAQAPGPWWNVVLKAWSQQIMDAFHNNNPNRISQNASLIHQTVDLGSKQQNFGSKIEGLEARVDSQATYKSAIELASNN